MSTMGPAALNRESPSTPANEWANSTKSALHLNANDIAKSNASVVPLSTASTPGPQLPGAYPHTPASDIPSGTTTQEASIMPVLEDAVLSASETVKQYLPSQVAAYLPEKSKSDKHSEATRVPDANAASGDQATSANGEPDGLSDRRVRAPENFAEKLSGPSEDTKRFDTSALTPKTSGLAAQDAVSVSDLSTVAQAGSESSKSFLGEAPAVSTPYDSQLPSYLGPLITERASDRPAFEGFTSVDTLHADPATGPLVPANDEVSTTSTASQKTTKPLVPETETQTTTTFQDDAVFLSNPSRPTNGAPEQKSAPLFTPSDLEREPQSLFDPTTTNVPASIAPGFDSAPANTTIHASPAGHPVGTTKGGDTAIDRSTRANTEDTGSHVQEEKAANDDQERGTEDRARSLTEGPKTSYDISKGATSPNSSEKLEDPQVIPIARDHPLGGEGALFDGLPVDKTHQREIERNYEDGSREAKPSVPPKDDRFDGFPATKSSSSSPVPARDSSDIHVDGTSQESNTTAKSRASGKVSWISKIKGEVKVISGKLSHDEERIEEGRRLMGKAPITASC